MTVSLYPWHNNIDPDPDLPFNHDLNALTERVFYLRQPWLRQLSEPKIVVTGASGWLGRYLLHAITAQRGVAEIVALDIAPQPAYLAQPRYREVRYRRLSNRNQELREVITSLRPQLIFHADYLWDLYRQDPLRLHEINVGGTQNVCEAASEAETRRLLVFADATLFAPAADAMNETAPVDCELPLPQSLYQAEQIALSYHRPGKTEVYSLRAPALYGPLIPTGLMLLAYLIAEGVLLGLPQRAPEIISTLSGHELALAAWLLALAPDPGHQVFHVSEGSVALRRCVEQMSVSLPREKILGIPSRLADIMKIGYQGEIDMPQPVFQTLATLSMHATDFLNQLRFTRKRPLFHPDIAGYVCRLPWISGKRFVDTIGWQPAAPLSWLPSTLAHVARSGWESVFPVCRQSCLSPQVQETIAIMDGVRELVAATIAFADHPEQVTSRRLPLADIEVDTKTLWLLAEEGWNQFLLALLKSETSEDFATLWPLWASSLGQEILTLIRYEHNYAQRLFPDDVPAQLKWLTRQLGGLNLKKIREYVMCAGLSYLLREIGNWCRQYQALAELLPDKSCGLFLADERGDIGVVLQARAGDVKIMFPRQEIEKLSRADYFPRRLAEFKRELHLHAAIGGRLKCFLSDMFSDAPGKSFMAHLGSDYLVAENSEYYSLIGRTLHGSKKNLFLFMRKSGQVDFAVRSQAGKINMLSHEEIVTVNRLLAVMPESMVIDALREASQGREQAVFLKIATVKKLLDGIVSPSRLHKVVLHVLEKTAKNRDNLQE